MIAKPGRVTVPGTGGKDLAPGTLRSILKQARLEGLETLETETNDAV